MEPVDVVSSSASKREGFSGVSLSSWRNVLHGAVAWWEREGRLRGCEEESSIDGNPNSIASSNF